MFRLRRRASTLFVLMEHKVILHRRIPPPFVSQRSNRASQQIRRQNNLFRKVIFDPSSSHSIRTLFSFSFNYVCLNVQELHKKNAII
ncbi:hypothetical protein CEXT_398391 [Caerostris extrusa]|uniref:Uncharacterized protein n=1 Tax=Caerostris extrusa TaxID=172846 RepID=A0AAV4RP25_CAEEX|nr:hypothetical protein CEXT_398391 [Caerostris extrusa]